MTAQANFTSSKPRFRQKCYDRSSANLVRLNSARNRHWGQCPSQVVAFAASERVIGTIENEITVKTGRQGFGIELECGGIVIKTPSAGGVCYRALATETIVGVGNVGGVSGLVVDVE